MFDEEKDEQFDIGGVYDEDEYDVEVATDEDEMDGGVYDEDFFYDEDGTFYDKKGRKRGVIKKLGGILNPLAPFKAIGSFVAKKKKAKKAKKANIANALMKREKQAEGINKIPLITGGKSSSLQAIYGVGKASKAIKAAVESKSVVVPVRGIEDINILTDNILLQEQSYNQIVQDIRIAVSGAAKKRTDKGFMPIAPGNLVLQVLNSKFFAMRVRMSNTYTDKKYDAVKMMLSGVGCDPIEFIVIPKEGSLVQEFVAFSVNLSQSVGRIVPATSLTLTINFPEAIEGEAFYVEGYNAAHCPNIEA